MATLYVWDDGDWSVGLPGGERKIEEDINEEDREEFREAERLAYAEFHSLGTNQVYALFEEERRELEEAERAAYKERI
jgi:hypothetical protein